MDQARRAQAMQDLLAERDLDILAYAARGLTRKEIAHKLGVSHGSVKNRLTYIYAVLHEDCLVGAMWAVGWVHIDWFPDVL